MKCPKCGAEIGELLKKEKKEETMSELEKKAKTGNFIKDLALRYDSANKHLWVRLEDAQELEQRVKSLETDRDHLLESLEICTKNLKYYAKETFELKQKLDVFHGFLVKVHNQSRDVKVNAFLGGIIKKFEELK